MSEEATVSGNEDANSISRDDLRSMVLGDDTPEHDPVYDEDGNPQPTDDNQEDDNQEDDQEGVQPEDNASDDDSTEEDDLLLPDDLDAEDSTEDEPEASEEEEPIPEGLKDKDVEAFKRLRQSNVDQKKQIEELTAKLNTGSQDLEQTNERIRSLEADIARADITRSAEFKNKYDQPILKKYASIEDLAETFGSSKEAMSRARSLKPQERVKFLSEEVPQAAATLHQAFSELGALQTIRHNAIQDHKATQKELAADRQVTLSTQVNASIMDISKDLAKDYTGLRRSKTNENWNKQLDQRIERAKEMATSTDIEVSELALKASLAEDYEKIIAKQTAIIQDLEANGGKRSKSTKPNLNQRGKTPPKSRSSFDPKNPRNSSEIAAIVAGG